MNKLLNIYEGFFGNIRADLRSEFVFKFIDNMTNKYANQLLSIIENKADEVNNTYYPGFSLIANRCISKIKYNNKDKFNDYLILEQKSLIENFNENLSDLFVEYSNNILQVLANSTLQGEIVNNFMQKINDLTDEKVESVNKLNVEDMYISSNDELTDKQKDFIKDSLVKKGFKFKDIQYTVDKKLILGIELKAKSYVLSWNVRELTNNFISTIDNKINDRK